MDGPKTFEDLIGRESWQSLLTAGRLWSFPPGRVILRQGDPGGFLYALESGRVKLLAHAEDGAELLLTVRGAGQLLGELAGDGRRTATVVALDRCTARLFTVGQFDGLLSRRGLEAAFRLYLTSKFDQAVTRQVDLAHRRAIRRIARLLLDVVRLAPSGAPEPLRVPFTQEELATSLGLSRSTVADQLAKLRAAGALAPGPQLVVADISVLATWALS